MKKRWTGMACLVGVATLVMTSGPASASSPLDLSWKEGIRLSSEDGNFKFKAGGRLMNDWTWWANADEDVEAFLDEDLEDSVEWRRARFYVSGQIYENVHFKAQYDFAGGDADLKDAWIAVSDVPGVGHVKAGHFKEPFSLNELTSSKYLVFLERALPNVFAPGRNAGVSIYDAPMEERMTWALGAFKDVDDFGEGSGNENYAATARLTGLPYCTDEGDLLHLGIGASVRGVDEVRYRQRPEAHFSPRFVNTDHFEADSVGLVGLEAALVQGPASLSAEYMMSSVASDEADDPTFHGFYIQGGYFLTGERLAYKKSAGAFSRVKPDRNLGEEGGAGAWQVAARYSFLDLDDADLEGGQLQNASVGLNWWLNPNTRMMFDYVLSDLDDVGETGAALMRLQVDF